MPDSYLIGLAKDVAVKEACDPVLVCAIIEQESNWQTYSIRYEPAFMAKYVAPQYTTGKITATEAWSRGFSWGLMQLMGQVSREIGYSGPLPQLCDPTTGITWGCRLLVKKLTKADGNVALGLLLWNGGGAPKYPEQVIARQVNYR